jgi:hypothetical protein
MKDNHPTCDEHHCTLVCPRCEARRRGALGGKKAAANTTTKQRRQWGRMGAKIAAVEPY